MAVVAQLHSTPQDETGGANAMFDRLTSAIDDRHRGFFAKAGDARQVWALDTDTAGLVYLPEDGVDEQLRKACEHGRLRCPMTDCPDPRFIARGGELRRHHFAHKVAHTKHTTAAVFRGEAVAMLADWARRYPSADVATSDESDPGAVAIRSKRTGKLVTLAITYDRNYPYCQDQACEPHDQLLVGHTRGLLLPREQHPRTPGVWCCAHAQLVGTMIALQGVAVAVNPQQRLVATLMTVPAARDARLIPAGPLYHPYVCVVDELDACHLDHTGLVTPAIDALRARQASQAKRTPTQPRRPAPGSRAAARATQRDERGREYLRRARGLDTPARLALIKEIFLPDKPG